MQADQSTMLPPFDGEIVSPELALVDAELGARARAALTGPVVTLPAPAVVVRREPAATPPSPSSLRVPRPVLTLLATAAASLVVTAFTGFDEASGEPPRAAAPAEGAASTAARATPAGSPAVASGKAAPVDATSSSPSFSSTHGPQGGAVGGRTPASSAASPALTRVAELAAPIPAESATRLVWDGAAGAAAYDVQLRRGGAVIYSSTSSAPEALVPRSWEKDGMAFVLQPEDQLYVWPVVDGRRVSSVVDGELAMDTTDVVRMIELSQHP
ncbi:MAG: hypothetical protein ACRDPX_14180 [Gaiellaceae bacterium]